MLEDLPYDPAIIRSDYERQASHPAMWISNPFADLSSPFQAYGEAYIDTLMIPVITHLWDCAIRTTACCEGDNDFGSELAYILLEPDSDLALAQEIVSNYGQIISIEDPIDDWCGGCIRFVLFSKHSNDYSFHIRHHTLTTRVFDKAREDETYETNNDLVNLLSFRHIEYLHTTVLALESEGFKDAAKFMQESLDKHLRWQNEWMKTT